MILGLPTRRTGLDIPPRRAGSKAKKIFAMPLLFCRSTCHSSDRRDGRSPSSQKLHTLRSGAAEQGQRSHSDVCVDEPVVISGELPALWGNRVRRRAPFRGCDRSLGRKSAGQTLMGAVRSIRRATRCAPSPCIDFVRSQPSFGSGGNDGMSPPPMWPPLHMAGRAGAAIAPAPVATGFRLIVSCPAGHPSRQVNWRRSRCAK